ncbi:STAS domain-containing protein [Sulfitobacter sp. M57]|uniref:STAS domain-containing protein n=1 Tax=unclassified Sulfitobacter TaxID=196795 RepID=UPI0023E31A1F|nr:MULTISPECIES: STAS domain-containing protein [unclassified Sulfitobacter]MDF3415355.1 STAS domain-containing protein [Sulfitobacter sp. KE5]MDF3422836.1 STAS domain-containing protein [Sulfitobacter sp. KE43]MDF3433901.1 STAS domain-containing protein [Sulfitobacter sp. KE42]MDF3459541.1 STAS domain-containing protein [Sulfitobacter sp. S74]MDF3463440.1 STAS domain-containing protein [Sulfitobacter sp. Ks18]
MELQIKSEAGVCIVSVCETRIDAASALDFKEAVRQGTQDAPAEVVMDLTQVSFIDSSGLGAIVATMKHLAPDRRLILAGLTPPVEKVFRLTRMDSVFRIHLTLEEALRAQCE